MNSHMYFEDNSSLPSKPFTFKATILNQEYTFKSDLGVFSKDEFDYGSLCLLKGLSTLSNIQSLLDFGAGIGGIGIVASTQLGIEKVDGVEVNPRALALAKENALINHANVNFMLSDAFDKVTDRYDCIAANPPIRVGKEKLYQWYIQAKEYLNENGCLVMVVRVKQGAKSTIEFCQEQYRLVEILYKKKGFVVFACYK